MQGTDVTSVLQPCRPPRYRHLCEAVPPPFSLNRKNHGVVHV